MDFFFLSSDGAVVESYDGTTGYVTYATALTPNFKYSLESIKSAVEPWFPLWWRLELYL